jgi:hypothetical protein
MAGCPIPGDRPLRCAASLAEEHSRDWQPSRNAEKRGTGVGARAGIEIAEKGSSHDEEHYKRGKVRLSGIKHEGSELERLT